MLENSRRAQDISIKFPQKKIEKKRLFLRPVRAPVANLASLRDARDVFARVLVALHARSVQPQTHVPAVGALRDLVRALTNARGFYTVRDQLPGLFVELGGAVELLPRLQGDLVRVPRAGEARAAAHVLDVADTERPARVVAERVEAVPLAPVVDEAHVPVAQLHVNAVAVPAELAAFADLHERPHATGSYQIRRLLPPDRRHEQRRGWECQIFP